MVKHALILCCLLALTGCALDPAGGTVAAGGSTDGHGASALRTHCDRIKVICIDARVPAMVPALTLPTVTLPAMPSLLTLLR